MAEVVTEMQEHLLPEYEELERHEICTRQQIRELIVKRAKLQTNITKGKKSASDYAAFIVFERTIHKWICEKESTQNIKLHALKHKVITRVKHLYLEGLACFPHEERLWNNFIDFCKKSMPEEVSKMYERMLTFHADKEQVWCNAALWIYEYNCNMDRVKNLFYSGLLRHPKSEAINKAFFDILLLEALKMNSTAQLQNDNLSEQQIGLQMAEIAYTNSKKHIDNVGYYIRLLERCESAEFKDITAPLQKLIVQDLMNLYPLNELLWHSLAQRELRGFNMSDLQQRKSIADAEQQPMVIIENSDLKKSNQAVWKNRNLKQRLELCFQVYDTAVKTLKTTEMMSYFIDAMLTLNQDMATQAALKRKYLALAFRTGRELKLLSAEHYCTYIRMLLLDDSNESMEIAESSIKEALELHKSVQLYELWLSIYIRQETQTDEIADKVFEILQTAHKQLCAESLPIWNLVAIYYKTFGMKYRQRILQLYKLAMQETHAAFGQLRADYLDFCYMCTGSLAKTRKLYDDICALPPVCLELHKKMAEIESSLLERTEQDINQWRSCLERTVQIFGKSHVTVWLDYLQFERQHGHGKLAASLYERAKHTLEPRLVETFVEQFVILNNKLN